MRNVWLKLMAMVCALALCVSMLGTALAQPEPINEPRCKPEEVDLNDVREENGRLVGMLHLPESPYLFGEVRIDCPILEAFPAEQAQTLNVAYKSMGKKGLETAMKAVGQSTKKGELHQWSDAKQFMASYSLWGDNAEPWSYASDLLRDASFFDDPAYADTYAQAKEITRTLLAQLGGTAYEPLLHANRYDAEHAVSADSLACYSHGEALYQDTLESFRSQAKKYKHTEGGLTMVNGMYALYGLPVMYEYSWMDGQDCMGAESEFRAIVSDVGEVRLFSMEAFRNTEGSAYALLVPTEDGQGVARMDVLDAAKVTPLRDVQSREIWYQFTLDDGKLATVHSSNMIALHHMSANGERSVRPVDVLRGTLDYDRQIKEFSISQLEGVNCGVILNIPGPGLNTEKKNAAIEQFLSAYRDSGGRVVVLEGGITATTLSGSPVDARVLDVERITKNRVATVYNLPPHMLGDYSDTNYDTAEQSKQEYLDFTILPIVCQWESEFNLKRLTPKDRSQGYAFRSDLRAMRWADVKTMADMYQKAVRGGWLKPNEVRENEGYPPDPSGDELMGSRDLVPLKLLMTGEVNDNGTESSASINDGKYTITSVAADHDIAVIF